MSSVIIQPVNPTGRRPKTVVLHDPTDSFGRRLKKKFFGVLNPVLTRVRPYATPLAKPRTLIILGVLTGVLFAGAIYYYIQLAAEIDARLQTSALDNSVGIFTAPFKLSVGDTLPVDQFTEYLRTVGYQQRSATEGDVTGSFEVNENSIVVFPGDAASIQRGLNPVRIEEDKNGRVVSLTSPKSGERLQSTTIESRTVLRLSSARP